MPWDNNTGGGGRNTGGGPWGQAPGGGGPRRGGTPSLEDILNRGRDRFKGGFPGGRWAVVGGVFDYMGDARTDLPIFQAARLAILVHPSTRLLTRARASCRVGHVFD